MKKAWLGVAAVAASYTPGANAGVNNFTLTGPEGGYVQAMAVQPGHPEVVLASTNHGLYRSTDAGASWTDLSTRSLGMPTVLAYAPGAADRVYGGATRLMVSTDAGLTFTNTNTPAPARELLAVAGTRVYTASYAGDILRSDDGMQNWTTLTVPWPTGGAGVLYSIAADPSNADVLYACAIGRGLYKTINGGDTWITPPAGSPCSRANEWTDQFAVSPADPNRVLVPTSEGFFVSSNGGSSWTQLGTMPLVPWVSFDPAAPNNVITMQYGGLILRSSDGGLNWQSNPTAPDIKLDQRIPPAWTGVAGHFYLPTADGPLFSDDNGATFTLRVSGMHAARLPQIVAADDGTIYAAQSNGSAGVYRRGNTGWTALDTAGLLARKLNPFALYDLAVAPGDSSRLYTADLSDGLYRSVNGGASWLGPSPPQSSVADAVIVDPSNPMLAYAMTYQGLKRTFDGGASFSASCGALPGSSAEFLRVDRQSSTTVYVGGASPPNVRLFKSTNGCQSFAAVTGQFTFLNDLAIDPVDGKRLFLAHVEGVDRSADGGLSWQAVHFNLPQGDALPGFRVFIDPAQRSTLWVMSISSIGVLRSVDDGATWQRLPMPSEAMGTYLESGVLDPSAPDTVLVGATGWGILEFQAAPDLEITASAPAGYQRVGTDVTVTLHVTNKGPLDASPGEVSLPLSGLAVTAPAGCSQTTGTLHCLLPALHVGETRDIPLTLALGPTPGRIDMTAEVTGHERDAVISNNAATWTLWSDLFADLSVELGPPAGTPQSGTAFQYTVTARNAGPDTVATTVAVSVSGASVIQAPDACALGLGGHALCIVPLLAPGTPAVITLTLNAAAAGTVTVDSTVSFAGQEIDAANNHATGTASVQAPPSAPPAPPASPPAKKGGGGGRFDWFALALLCGLVVRAGRAVSWRRAVPA